MQVQGNSKTGTLPRDMNSSVFPDHIRECFAQVHVQQVTQAESRSPSTDPAVSLTGLLNAAPVDLCRVRDEMQAHPDLQALVVRLACYLSFLPDTSATPIEEAVVVVGTDRLRVLVYFWSLLRQRGIASNPGAPAESNPASAQSHKVSSRASAWHTEIACLANFLESLGFDSVVPPQRHASFAPSGSQEAEFLELTEMLARDIISFSPLIEPAFRREQRSVAPGVNASSRKEAE